MTGGRRAAAICCVAFAVAGATAQAAWKQVAVGVALQPRVATKPGESALVARVRAGDHPTIDVGAEITRWLRRELARGTALKVQDVAAPEIPEQRAEVLVANDAFWRALGKQFNSDLILAAIATFKSEDRSGFVDQDYEDPLTGQTRRQSRYIERRGFSLKLEVFFFQGANGALVGSDVWQEQRTVDDAGANAEELQALYDLLETMRDDLSATLNTTRIQEPRFIWTE